MVSHVTDSHCNGKMALSRAREFSAVVRQVAEFAVQEAGEDRTHDL